MECQSLTNTTMPTIHDQQWYNLLRDYFNVDLDAESVKRWWIELERQYHRRLNNALICNAIRWASDSSNYTRPERGGKPTVVELGRWIRLSVSQGEKEQDEKQDCQLCGKAGWLQYYPDWRQEWTLEDYSMAYSSSLPCVCANGKRVIETCMPYKGMDEQEINGLKNMANLATRQYALMMKRAKEQAVAAAQVEPATV